MNELLEIQKVALDQIANCEDLKALNDIRVNYLGKKGPIQDAMKAMKNMEKSERAEFGKVSNQVKQAIQQAIEDKNFYNHNGFDYLRIAKALFTNLFNGEIVQGASTISQQYAKNLYLDFEQSWERKWKEMWLTFRLENNYSKDEILEGYLNTIN